MSSSPIFSLYNLFSRSPTKLAPRYLLYFPGALPIKPISPNAGREHPLGHPDIRMIISLSRSPYSSIISSIFSSNDGKYRATSDLAKPHVSKATQHIEIRLDEG